MYVRFIETRDLTCPICGVKFRTTDKRVKCCSRECSEANCRSLKSYNKKRKERELNKKDLEPTLKNLIKALNTRQQRLERLSKALSNEK